jgi:hypothetical protein
VERGGEVPVLSNVLKLVDPRSNLPMIDSGQVKISSMTPIFGNLKALWERLLIGYLFVVQAGRS